MLDTKMKNTVFLLHSQSLGVNGLLAGQKIMIFIYGICKPKKLYKELKDTQVILLMHYINYDL